MINKLERVIGYNSSGNCISRLPDIEEITYKINEIIDYINDHEIEKFNEIVRKLNITK